MANTGGDRVWHVLVVDDEAGVLDLVRRTLEFEDFASVVVTATTAGEAIALAAERTPDLVVLDHRLGGPLTGLQVADQFRLAYPETRLILFSVTPDVIDLRERVDAVVSKVDVGDLPAVIRRVLAPEPI
jgi:DNA-binding NarL/FixJ family response regulator